MSKIAVVYWSGTGNTEAMANFVADGATSAGAATEVIPCADFSADKAVEYDAFAFGCPAMGAEQLGEDEVEPMFAGLEDSLGGKKIALFGSYGWGDGEWMRGWEKDCDDSGIRLVCESVTCCEAPDDAALDACRALGKELAK